jgi:DNA ligase-1
MKAFAQLFAELDASTATAAKVAAMQRYFASVPPADAAWAVYFLCGGKPRQVVPTATLRSLACARAGIEDWLFDECYQAVGDLAETIALVLPPPQHDNDDSLASWVEERLLPLRGAAPESAAAQLLAWWDELDTLRRFLLVKLIGGGFRVGVSKLLVQRALAAHAGIDAKLVAQRMMGGTGAGAAPTAHGFAQLLAAPGDDAREAGQPYPFFLAHALAVEPPHLAASLGAAGDWLAEWKYDGIRAQVVRRAGGTWIWSRGEELVTERFPDVAASLAAVPDGTVLDGEIVVWKDGRPAPFAQLQRRIGRKTLGRRLLAEVPAVFIAYDLLEAGGEDWRARPQHERRAALEDCAARAGLPLSPLLEAADWPALAALRDHAREQGVEGLMLKHRDARYGSGRTKADGVWWKWKVDPLTIDAVLVHAQAGHGRRAGVYTDYTFAVWSRPPADAAEAQAVVEAIGRREAAAPGALQLVVFAKAYSGLTDAEFRRVDGVVRKTTLEKFGPVRAVLPSMVFELGFEGINASRRHKSGIAVRFPRMLRIRDDKPLHEADTLDALQRMLNAAGSA